MPRLSLSAWGFQQVYLDTVKEGASCLQAGLERYGIWVDYQASVPHQRYRQRIKLG
jgi:hypothetical protein